MSSLTSLLARDEIVSVHAIEDALQRQVLEGGEIDTALLELGVVPENTLSAYLATTLNFQSVAREELMGVSDETLKLLPLDLARKHRMVPLQRLGSTLIVCTARPPSADILHSLERAVGLAMVVKIAVHARVEAALATFYGVEISSRMRQLAAQLDAADAGPVPEVEPAEEAVLRIDSALLHAFDSQPPAAPTDLEDDAKEDDVQTSQGAATTSASYSFAPPVVKPAVAWSPPVHSEPPPGDGQSRAGRPRARSRRVSVVPKGPLSPERARQLLDTAADRDTVVDIFFSFARQYFDCSALFAVREEQLFGLEAYGVVDVDAVSAISIPILPGGVVRQVLTTMAPRITELAEIGEGSALGTALGRADAQPSALIPVVVHQRVVSLLYGDCDGQALSLHDLTELLSLLPSVSLAFERIIRQRKQGAQQALQPRPAQVLQKALAEPPVQSLPIVSLAPHAMVGATTTQPTAATTSEDGAAKANAHSGPASGARTMDVLAALGMARPAPQPPDLSMPLAGRASPPRMSVPSKSPTKPPPGPGAYRSVRPGQEDRVGNIDFMGEDTPPTGTPPAAIAEAARPPTPAVSHTTPAHVELDAKSTHPESPMARRRSADSDKPLTQSSSPSTEQPTSKTEADNIAPSDPPRSTEPEIFSIVHALPETKPRVPSIIVDMGEDIRRLVDELARCGPGDEGPVLTALVKLGTAAVPILAERFPGPLWFDRSTQPNRLAMGRDVSAIARALLAFGAHAVPHVAQLMSTISADTRYYAALLAIERLEPLYLLAFGKAAFDSDPQVRQLAREALPRYRALPEFASVLADLRTRAVQEQATVEERLNAIEAISAVRDGDALLVLIELLDQGGAQFATPAHRALVLLTGQDFGADAASWRAFARATSGQSRVEWLIEALMQADEQHRALAGSELQKLTQVYFGYVASAPRRDRERVQRRYREWWDEQGRR